MPRGEKSSYSTKQKRQARDIEQSYERRGVSTKTAAKRAWATVNKLTGGAAKKAATKKTAAKKATRKTAAKKAPARKKAAPKKVARKRAS